MSRRQRARWLLGILLFAVGCSGEDEGSSWSWGPADGGDEGLADQVVDTAMEAADSGEMGDGQPDDGKVEAHEDVHGDVPDEQPDDAQEEASEDAFDAGPCPEDMVLVEQTCIDRFEAPNRQGASPLVMFHFLEAESWCETRGKRLCFDDEWTRACGGPQGHSYPYGDSHVSGECTDDKAWRAYEQQLLNGWPWSIATDVIESLEALLEAVRSKGAGAKAAADHVAWLYQAEPSGSKQGCTAGEGTYDLAGNVEEWTRRRSGGTTGYHGNLKGRYWAESRTCQQSVTTHGDTFRFYEIGFRCCKDVE
ncbi:MAG TPA: SUMF1/EgtB/PvdO family nonheme iron enzyme [Polyangiaceae bacterium]|nr:SUMF1/EgtB/PvdO family nonheme iron enzyme [Polyangiaceae bacterium]